MDLLPDVANEIATDANLTNNETTTVEMMPNVATEIEVVEDFQNTYSRVENHKCSQKRKRFEALNNLLEGQHDIIVSRKSLLNDVMVQLPIMTCFSKSYMSTLNRKQVRILVHLVPTYSHVFGKNQVGYQALFEGGSQSAT